MVHEARAHGHLPNASQARSAAAIDTAATTTAATTTTATTTNAAAAAAAAAATTTTRPLVSGLLLSRCLPVGHLLFFCRLRRRLQ